MSLLKDVILHDIFANRPAASIAGRLFYASDTFHRYRDNGTSWDLEDSSVSSGGGLLASNNLSDVSSAGTALANLSGAPNSAHFLTDRSEGLLTNEVNLGALASGLLFGTVSSSVAALSSKTLDLDGTLAANSDANVASQKAVKAYVDSQFSGGGGAPANAHFLTSQAESGLSAEVNLGALTTGLVFNTVSGGVAAFSSKVIGTDVQTHNANLDTIAAITPSNAQFLQSVSGAWAQRSGTQATANLDVFGGDSGSGGTKGLVPAPAAGDAVAGKFLKADGNFAIPSGTGGITANQKIAGITGVFDGGGSALTAGAKVRVRVPYAGTMTVSTVLVDLSGSVAIEVRKCTYAQYDAGSTHPVTGDKISASAPPTVSSATKAQDSTLTGWTTSVSAGDIIEFSLTSATTCTWCSVTLDITKS